MRLSYVSGFERFPDYSTCCIFSPFNSKNKAKDLFEAVKDMPDVEIKEYIKNNLHSYITTSMMEVLKYANINENITDEQIYEGYISLIYDFIKMKQRNSLEQLAE